MPLWADLCSGWRRQSRGTVYGVRATGNGDPFGGSQSTFATQCSRWSHPPIAVQSRSMVSPAVSAVGGGGLASAWACYRSFRDLAPSPTVTAKRNTVSSAQDCPLKANAGGEGEGAGPHGDLRLSW